MHAIGIKDEIFDFRLGTLGRDLLTIPYKANACGIADTNVYFA